MGPAPQVSGDLGSTQLCLSSTPEPGIGHQVVLFNLFLAKGLTYLGLCPVACPALRPQASEMGVKGKCRAEGLALVVRRGGSTRLVADGVGASARVRSACSTSPSPAAVGRLKSCFLFTGAGEAISVRKLSSVSFLSHESLWRPQQPGLDQWGLKLLGCGKETPWAC